MQMSDKQKRNKILETETTFGYRGRVPDVSLCTQALALYQTPTLLGCHRYFSLYRRIKAIARSPKHPSSQSLVRANTCTHFEVLIPQDVEIRSTETLLCSLFPPQRSFTTRWGDFCPEATSLGEWHSSIDQESNPNPNRQFELSGVVVRSLYVKG